jgi:hypothetical protein
MPVPHRVASSILRLLLSLATALIATEHLLEEVELRGDGEEEREECDENGVYYSWHFGRLCCLCVFLFIMRGEI